MADDQRVMRPLPVFPPELLDDPEVRAKIVSAKQSLNTPVLAQFGKGVPGSDRVLAFEKPTFACDYALVGSIDSPGLADAVAYVLHLTDDKRAATMVQWLSSTLGAEVREVNAATPRDMDGGTSPRDERRVDTGQRTDAGVGAGTPPPRDGGPRGDIDPNTYSDGNYRVAIRAAGEG